jgi:hypothetical protein
VQVLLYGDAVDRDRCQQKRALDVLEAPKALESLSYLRLPHLVSEPHLHQEGRRPLFHGGGSGGLFELDLG